MLYHPELGEKPAVRLFYTHHVHGGTYSVGWRESDDEKARATLKALRIRAKYGKDPEREQPGDWSLATRLCVPVFHILVTPLAHRKLMDGDLCACETLLD